MAAFNKNYADALLAQIADVAHVSRSEAILAVLKRIPRYYADLVSDGIPNPTWVAQLLLST